MKSTKGIKTLTSKEIKDTIKAIRSLENKGALLNGTTKKLPGKKEAF